MEKSLKMKSIYLQSQTSLPDWHPAVNRGENFIFRCQF